MSAESDLYAALSGSPAVVGLVSLRIYPDAIPEECQLPAIVFSRSGGEKIYGLDNSIHAERVRLRVVAWGLTRTSADSVASAVCSALIGAGLPPDMQDAAFDDQVGNFSSIVETDWWS